MSDYRDDDADLRAVTLQNARSIFLARQRAEEELVRARDALRQQSAEMADFFENASVGLHWVAPDGTILRVNQAELRLLGYTAQEYVGHHIAEFHADQDVIADILRRLAAGETLRDCEARMRCRDGSIKHVLIDSSALWRDGEFVHSRCFTRDVTDRQRVADVQGRLAAIVESSQDAIISKTLDSRILSWNAAAEQLFGYKANEVIGRLVTLLIPPERQDEERMILERLRRGERVEHYETVRVTKHGRRIDVSLTISPVRDDTGVIVGASKIARDITARKRAEQRLEFQNGVTRTLAESQSLTEAAPAILRAFCERLDWQVGALWQLDDTRGVLRCVNIYHVPSVPVPQFEAVSRARAFQLGVGLPGTIWASGQAAGVLDFGAEGRFPRAPIAAAEGLHGALAFPIALNDNVLGVIEFFSTEPREPDGDLLQMMTAVGSQLGQFIERKRAEAALHDADRRKDEFLAMLAHELRNPLAPIRNAVEIFRAKSPDEPELQWAAEVVDRQVHQMTRLVDDLLDVSRITRGKIVLRKEIVDLATIVNCAVEASRPLIEKWSHELTVTLPPQPVYLEADATRLAQVFLNLLNNAAKYTDPGGRISLSGEQRGNHVEVRVKDSGIGIPAEALAGIFEMFAQVERSVERSEGGLGIGLTLVQRLVDMHGGAVEARSAGLGQGSEFLVRLPIAPGAHAESQRARSPHGDLATTTAPARRILVVDDNQDAADSLGLLLRLSGNEVHTAHDGLAAVSAVAAFRPDVVLMDIGLPRLNGYEAARRIREQPGGQDMVLVALTGWGQDEDRRRCREAGFDHHMTKPLEFEALQGLLTQTSRRRR